MNSVISIKYAYSILLIIILIQLNCKKNEDINSVAPQSLDTERSYILKSYLPYIIIHGNHNELYNEKKRVAHEYEYPLYYMGDNIIMNSKQNVFNGEFSHSSNKANCSYYFTGKLSQDLKKIEYLEIISYGRLGYLPFGEIYSDAKVTINDIPLVSLTQDRTTFTISGWNCGNHITQLECSTDTSWVINGTVFKEKWIYLGSEWNEDSFISVIFFKNQY
jgi:hypothetical protein